MRNKNLTNKELQELLKYYPDDYPILFCQTDHYMHNVNNVMDNGCRIILVSDKVDNQGMNKEKIL